MKSEIEEERNCSPASSIPSKVKMATQIPNVNVSLDDIDLASLRVGLVAMHSMCVRHRMMWKK